MATGPGVNQGKTPFVEQFLQSNRAANLDAVNEAWKSAGNQGTVSESLVSKVRSRLKAAGMKGANGGAVEEAAAPAAKPKSSPKAKAKSSPKEAKAKSSPKGDKGKAKPEGEDPASSQPEAQEAVTGPAKSAFVEEVLGREPGANVKAVNSAWSQAGHEGKISDSIFYKVKRELGVTGDTASVGASEPETSAEVVETSPAEAASKPTAKKVKPGRAASPATVAPSDAIVELPTPGTTPSKSREGEGHGRVLHEIENEIDELMFRLKGLGGFADVLDALRTARRLLVRSHGE